MEKGKYIKELQKLPDGIRKNTKMTVMKQGPCGSFCVKYWLGDGCDEDCINATGIK